MPVSFPLCFVLLFWCFYTLNVTTSPLEKFEINEVSLIEYITQDLTIHEVPMIKVAYDRFTIRVSPPAYLEHSYVLISNKKNQMDLTGKKLHLNPDHFSNFPLENIYFQLTLQGWRRYSEYKLDFFKNSMNQHEHLIWFHFGVEDEVMIDQKASQTVVNSESNQEKNPPTPISGKKTMKKLFYYNFVVQVFFNPFGLLPAPFSASYILVRKLYVNDADWKLNQFLRNEVVPQPKTLQTYNGKFKLDIRAMNHKEHTYTFCEGVLGNALYPSYEDYAWNQYQLSVPYFPLFRILIQLEAFPYQFMDSFSKYVDLTSVLPNIQTQSSLWFHLFCYSKKNIFLNSFPVQVKNDPNDNRYDSSFEVGTNSISMTPGDDFKGRFQYSISRASEILSPDDSILLTEKLIFKKYGLEQLVYALSETWIHGFSTFTPHIDYKVIPTYIPVHEMITKFTFLGQEINISTLNAKGIRPLEFEWIPLLQPDIVSEMFIRPIFRRVLVQMQVRVWPEEGHSYQTIWMHPLDPQIVDTKEQDRKETLLSADSPRSPSFVSTVSFNGFPFEVRTQILKRQRIQLKFSISLENNSYTTFDLFLKPRVGQSISQLPSSSPIPDIIKDVKLMYTDLKSEHVSESCTTSELRDIPLAHHSMDFEFKLADVSVKEIAFATNYLDNDGENQLFDFKPIPLSPTDFRTSTRFRLYHLFSREMMIKPMFGQKEALTFGTPITSWILHMYLQFKSPKETSIACLRIRMSVPPWMAPLPNFLPPKFTLHNAFSASLKLPYFKAEESLKNGYITLTNQLVKSIFSHAEKIHPTMKRETNQFSFFFHSFITTSPPSFSNFYENIIARLHSIIKLAHSTLRYRLVYSSELDWILHQAISIFLNFSNDPIINPYIFSEQKQSFDTLKKIGDKLVHRLNEVCSWIEESDAWMLPLFFTMFPSTQYISLDLNLKFTDKDASWTEYVSQIFQLCYMKRHKKQTLDSNREHLKEFFLIE